MSDWMSKIIATEPEREDAVLPADKFAAALMRLDSVAERMSLLERAAALTRVQRQGAVTEA